MTTLKLGFLCSACAAWVACGGANARNSGNQDAEFDSLVDPTQAANSTYFAIHPDAENCAAPPCGGYWVERANRHYTVCTDGQARESCYVSQLDLTGLGLDAMSEASLRTHLNSALVRGALVTDSAAADASASLRVKEAWLGHPNTDPAGTVLRVRSSGLSCLTYPCSSYTAERLNSDQPQVQVAAINLDGIANYGSATQKQFGKSAGVLIAAELSTVSGPAGSAPMLKASDYYLPVAPAGLTDDEIVCGTPGLAPCPIGQYCKFEPQAACGRLEKPGLCDVPPDACPEVYEPVCGCDLKTYSNACMAARQGVSVQRLGECITLL